MSPRWQNENRNRMIYVGLQFWEKITWWPEVYHSGRQKMNRITPSICARCGWQEINWTIFVSVFCNRIEEETEQWTRRQLSHGRL